MWLINKKHTIIKSGVLQGMVDIHSHLLWSVDDGSKDEQRSRTMIAMLKEIGINKSFATPHIMAGLTENNAENLTEIFNNSLLRVAEELHFEVRLAAEYMLDEAFMPHLTNREKLLSYDGKHLLIEMSHLSPARALYEVIFEIESDGYIPILAHPERYGYFKMVDYEKLKDRGCLFQMNLLSLSDNYGKEVKKAAKLLFEADMYDFLGSDIHGMNMVEAVKQIVIPSKDTNKLGDLVNNNALLWL